MGSASDRKKGKGARGLDPKKEIYTEFGPSFEQGGKYLENFSFG